MLQDIRDNAQSNIAKVIVALMIVPFVFFGIDSFFSGGGEKNVAEVNGEEISERELLIGIESQKRRIQSQMGEAYDPNVVNDALLKPQVLESLVQRQLYQETTEELGLTASELLLDQRIVASPEFQENGQFSTERYEGLLRANGMLPSQHRQQLRTQITASQMISGFAQSDFATEADAKVAAKVTHQRRDIRYITIPAVQAADIDAINDTQVREFYEANQSDFMRDDEVQLDFLELKLSDYKIEVSDDEIKEAYAREKLAYEPEIEWQVAHILVEINDEKTRDEAYEKVAQVQAALAAGGDFAELAAQFSDDSGSAESGGELGRFGPGIFPEFDEALHQLANAEVSEVVETESGLHLLLLIDTQKSEFPGLEQSRDRIVQELQGSRATPEYISGIEELEEATFGADDLRLAAEEFGLVVQTTTFFSRAQGDGIASYPVLRNYAFSDEFLSEGQNSEKIELDDEHVVIVRLKELREAHPRPLIEVSEQIRTQLHEEAVALASTEKANDVMQAVTREGSVETAAEALSLEWQVQLQAERNSLTVDRAILEAAFSEEGFNSGTALLVASLANGDRAVVEVANVQPGTLAMIGSTDRDALKNGLSQMLGGRSFDDFFKAVRDKAKVVTL